MLDLILAKGLAKRQRSGRGLSLTAEEEAALERAFQPFVDYGGADPPCADVPASDLGSDAAGAGSAGLSAGG